MSDLFNNLPPGFNAPYGPYTTGGAGNPANHGFAPKSSANTGNPLIDMVLPMAIQAFTGKAPEFSRPQTSDHAYTAMQERMRVSKLMHPSVVASNPELKGLGKAGQNSLIQTAMDSITDGGSRVEAFNTIFGNFSSSLAGPGIKNMDENAIGSANILKNFDAAFTDEEGKFDFDKSSGFNRTETFKNIAAYNKQFGGFGGTYDRKTDTEKNKEYLDIAKQVMDRPAIADPVNGVDATPEEINEDRKKLREAEEKINKSKTPDLTPSVDVLKNMLGGQKDGSSKEKIQSIIDEASGVKPSTNVDRAIDQIENPENEKNTESGAVGEIVKNLNSEKNQTSDISSIAAKIEAAVSKFGSSQDKENLEKAKQTQVQNSAVQSQEAKQIALDLINKHGTPEDQKKAAEIRSEKGTGSSVLAEQTTEQNKEKQQAEIKKIQEVNKMTREGQNVFGQDMPLDEVMQNIKDLTEGMGDVETPDVTGLLQKIQATAVVVDMSNDALVKYFDVVKNMYKGMGIKGPSSTEMAQNALLSAKASVDARKDKAQKDGKMYTGPSAEEEAQKIAEIQGGVRKSGAQANVMGFLDTLSDEGTEGDVKKRIQEKINQGDLAGAEKEIRGAAQSGEISTEAAARGFSMGDHIYRNDSSEEQQKRIKAGLSKEGAAVIGGEDVDANFRAVKEHMGNVITRQGRTGGVARQILGEGSTEKIKEFVNNDLREGDLTDTNGLSKKLQEKYGIDKLQGEKLAKTIQSDLEKNNLNDKKIALTNPEREAKQKELQKQREEVQQEVKTVAEERGGQLKNMNFGAEAFAGIKVAFKKLQGLAKDGTQVTAEDVAKEQGKDWNKMSEKEKKAFKASVDLADSSVNKTENETTKQYKKIEEESRKKATEEIEEKSSRFTLTEEQKKSQIEERTNQLTSEAVKEAGIDGGSLEKGEEEKSKSFDPKEAVDRISRLLEAIASKLDIDTTGKTMYSSANAKTENNGGWSPGYGMNLA